MPEKKPFFSVIMPTRNRANLLPLAIQSILNQTFGDFEIIVSDNFSIDETPQVARQFGDARIKYFRTEKPLSINDSFEFALNQATGEYISFLPDDDAFSPITFERVKQIIDEQRAEIVAFHYCFYNYDANFVPGFDVPANSLAIRNFSSELTRFSAAEGIRNLFSGFRLNRETMNDKFIVPILANAVYNRAVFERIAKVNKKMFATTPNDMYLAAAIFFVIESYFCLDEPMHVWSQWSDNATASPHRKGNKLKEHYEKLLNGQKPRYTPLKYALRLNLNVSAMLNAKHDFGVDSREAEVDWANYFHAQYYELAELRKIGIDVSEEMRELKTALSKQPKDLTNKVRSKIRASAAKRFLSDYLPVRAVESLKALQGNLQGKNSAQLNVSAPSNFTVVRGEEAGFDNVLDAARILSDKIINELRGKQNSNGLE